jgi:hypothetical protein
MNILEVMKLYFKTLKQILILGEFIHFYVYVCMLKLHEFLLLFLKVQYFVLFASRKIIHKKYIPFTGKMCFLNMTVKQQLKKHNFGNFFPKTPKSIFLKIM